MTKKIVKVRCPKCGQLDEVDRIKSEGTSVLTYTCSKCGETHTNNLEEDFSQATARIVKEATQD